MQAAIPPDERRVRLDRSDLDFGFLGRDDVLEVISEMGEDGVIFADGIEADRLDFAVGQVARIYLAQQRLQLVVPTRAT